MSVVPSLALKPHWKSGRFFIGYILYVSVWQDSGKCIASDGAKGDSPIIGAVRLFTRVDA